MSDLEVYRDERGELAEFLPSVQSGRVYVFRARPGVTRGNHYHKHLIEKFLVVAGRGVIRLRQRHESATLAIPVDGKDFCVVDIPANTVHSIENVGTTDLVVVAWAGARFDPNHPDTYLEEI